MIAFVNVECMNGRGYVNSYNTCMSWCFSAILLHEGSTLARICRRLIYLIQEEEPHQIGSQKSARQKLMSPLDDGDGNALTAEIKESGLCKNPAQREEAVRIQVPENLKVMFSTLKIMSILLVPYTVTSLY